MKKIILLFVVFISANAFAQNDRVNDYNQLVWLQNFTTLALNKKWSAHITMEVGYFN
jgi:hypothetical protein